MQQLTAAAIISIRGAPPSDAYLIEGAEVQIAAVKTDPKRNNGDYYGKEEPLVRRPDDGFQDHPAGRLRGMYPWGAPAGRETARAAQAILRSPYYRRRR
jgi:hypothetical protein